MATTPRINRIPTVRGATTILDKRRDEARIAQGQYAVTDTASL
jgi:hypothetical protein